MQTRGSAVTRAAVAIGWIVFGGFAGGVWAADGPLMRLSTLSPAVGEPVDVRLNLPTGESWRDANVAAFFVRQGDEQWSVPIEPVNGGDVVRLTFDRPGDVLVVLSAGRDTDRGFSDSWQRTPYCSKAVLNVRPREGSDDAPTTGGGITGKVGQKIEVLPLAHPRAVRVGDDLPVRVYYEGGKRRGVDVRASVLAPDGDGSVAIEPAGPTDSVGTTWFRVARGGSWRISWSDTVDGVTYTAEVLFEIPPDIDAKEGE